LDVNKIGNISVDVVGLKFPNPIACEVNFTRFLDVDLGENSPDEVHFVSQNPNLLTIEKMQLIGSKLRLKVTPLQRGKPVIEARLGSPNGPVLAFQEIDEFTWDFPANSAILFDADTGIGESSITIKADLDYLNVIFNMFASKASFKNGAWAFSAKTDTFFKKPDPSFGFIRTLDYVLEMPMGEMSYCFSAVVFQGDLAVSRSR
jgi:hypothetical protein